VSPRSRNRRAAELAASVLRRGAYAAVLGAALAAIGAARAAADPPPCDPIEAPRLAQLAPSEDPGVMGSHVGVADYIAIANDDFWLQHRLWLFKDSGELGVKFAFTFVG